ncbi:MAG: chemotaxis protein CheX [Myxococcota bacterium]
MNGAEALRMTAFEVLEDGLFLILDEVPPQESPEGYRFTMAIEGGGQPTMEVGIRASGDLARTLTANLLGLDAGDVTNEDVRSAVAEALNLVAGTLMVHTIGPEPEVELRPPVVGGEPKGDVVAFGDGEGQIVLWYAA